MLKGKFTIYDLLLAFVCAILAPFSILQGFGEVFGFYLVAPGQVGDGAGDFNHLMETATGET